jgi:hypothetical protein
MTQKLRPLILSLIILGSLSACAAKPRVIFQIPQIEIPAQPTLPAVQFTKEDGKACVDVENAKKLYIREQLLKADGDGLRQLLNAINTEFGIDE